MQAKDLKYFRKKLLEKKLQLISVVQKTEDYSREAADSQNEAMDLVDRAASTYTKEFMFSKSASDRQLLQVVVEALDRIEEGVYGECTDCRESVGLKRLEAVPWAALCLDCQEQSENQI